MGSSTWAGLSRYCLIVIAVHAQGISHRPRERPRARRRAPRPPGPAGRPRALRSRAQWEAVTGTRRSHSKG
eukprot:3662935-Prymnesium_polylepis.2